jgi:hypothetical protein
VSGCQSPRVSQTDCRDRDALKTTFGKEQIRRFCDRVNEYTARPASGKAFWRGFSAVGSVVRRDDLDQVQCDI